MYICDVVHTILDIYEPTVKAYTGTFSFVIDFHLPNTRGCLRADSNLFQFDMQAQHGGCMQNAYIPVHFCEIAACGLLKMNFRSLYISNLKVIATTMKK